MQSLQGIVSMAVGPTQNGADVTLITGSNFSVKLPRTAAKKLPISTPTTVAPAYPILGPVSSAIQSLPFYDPRACPATK